MEKFRHYEALEPQKLLNKLISSHKQLQINSKTNLRTFALIVSAHPYCASKFTPSHR